MINNRKYKILIAEDDTNIVELLKIYLEKNGYDVICCYDGFEAYQEVEKEEVDLAIFDVMMPKMNGYELTKKVRAISNIPIIILSAKNKDNDKIVGLEYGADDYMTKPFNPNEVVARVKASLRRYYDLNDDEKSAYDLINVGELSLDLKKVQLYKKGNPINLTATEYRILSLLMKAPGKIFTKVQIFESINGYYLDSDDNTLMVHISNLRDKIEDDSKNPKYIKTVRGLGYKIEYK